MAEAFTIIQSSADGILVTDANRIIVVSNPAIERLTGYTDEDLLGRPCAYLLDARDYTGRLLCDILCPFHGEESLDSIEVTIARKDGTRVWVELSCGRIKADDGRLVGAVYTLRDASQRKEAEQVKDDYISIAAHDLRTPVTTIKGYAQLMRRWLARGDTSRFEEGLKTVEKESDHLVQLVEALLDVSRIQSGHLQLSPHRLNLSDFIEEVVARVRQTADTHHVVLERIGSVWGQWDRVRIEQVLNNLIDNAIKYSPNGGDVRIVVEQDEGEVRIHVSDRGIGIPAADMGKVFGRHQRLSNAAELDLQGSGLGLYIVKGIVEAHGGRVWVQSELNVGSTFSFALPTEDYQVSDFTS